MTVAVTRAQPAASATTSSITIPGRHLTVFYRSLATLYLAGVRLDRSLQMLGGQCEDPRLGAVSVGMAADLTRGKALSVAMTRYPRVFGTLERSLVRIGETSGRLHMILGRLADQHEKQEAVRLKLRSALTYPALLFVMLAVTLAVGPPLLFGGLFRLLAEFNLELPWLTRVLLGISRLGFWTVPLLAVGLVGGWWLLRRSAPLWAPRVPVLRDLRESLVVTRFTRALQITCEAGVPLLTGLNLAGEAQGCPQVAERVSSAAQAMEEGCSLSQGLERGAGFPRLVSQMVRVGEESGHMPDLLGRCADLYEQRLDFGLDTLTALVEPLVMLVMGVITAGVVLAMMLPMSQLMKVL